VHCAERGELIEVVWKSYLGLLEKALNYTKCSSKTHLEEQRVKQKEMSLRYQRQLLNNAVEIDEL
jgi:hypothetical protein